MSQLRYAIYARVSTSDKGQEVEQQLPDLREFVARLRGQVVMEFLDEESGGTDKRAGFQAMLKAAHQRRFDVLVFWSLDRFSREGVLPTLQHLEKLRLHNIGFCSYTEPALNTTGPMGDAIIALMAALANQRLVNIRESTKRALAQKKAKGVRLGRPTVSEKIIEQARELRAAGKSFRAISSTLQVPASTIHAYLAPEKSIREGT